MLRGLIYMMTVRYHKHVNHSVHINIATCTFATITESERQIECIEVQRWHIWILDDM